MLGEIHAFCLAHCQRTGIKRNAFIQDMTVHFINKYIPSHQCRPSIDVPINESY